MVATVACVLIAGLVLVRRAVKLFTSSGAAGCGTGACSTCPSQREGGATAPSDFISLDALVEASHKPH
jgi:hypothetical protein